MCLGRNSCVLGMDIKDEEGRSFALRGMQPSEGEQMVSLLSQHGAQGAAVEPPKEGYKLGTKVMVKEGFLEVGAISAAMEEESDLAGQLVVGSLIAAFQG